MPHNRYFSSTPLVYDTILLSGDEHHHLFRVMRKAVGDAVELIDGLGRLAQGSIASQDKSSTTITIHSLFEEKPPRKTLTLVLAYLKSSHLDFAIEKAVELGVDAIWLFRADRSEKKELSENHKERLEAIIMAATKQCGRLFLPCILQKTSLLKCLEDAQKGYFLYGNPSSSQRSLAFNDDSSVYIAIGPESGFSEKEEKILSEKAKGILLHRNVLRAETAAIAAVSQLYPLLH